MPVRLHIIHDLGGGSATWLRDFCLADRCRKNLILKSFTQSNAMGCGVALYQNISDEVPLTMWHFSAQIEATVVTHAEYLSVLSGVISQYSVGAILVSSVIGHSLDVLNTDLPTVVVNHDYFPYCPAINVHFGGVCTQCDPSRISECYRDNPEFNPFVTFLPPQRVGVREHFLTLIARANVTMVVPSRSVEENLVRLDARFRSASFVTIEHGYGSELQKIVCSPPVTNDRLRILVLGQVSVPKGLELLRANIDALTEFADVYLLGCRELGEFFKFRTAVHVLENYEVAQLPNHIAAINPDVGLLMSVVPETFSYALTELMALGVPVAATRVGSFPERIHHQQNGYLYEPNAASLLELMRTINIDRQSLQTIRNTLRGWKPRSAEAMVDDYHALLQTLIKPPPTTVTKDGDGGVANSGDHPRAFLLHPGLPPLPGEEVARSLTISRMWKDIKSLNLRLSLINQARLHQTKKIEQEHHESLCLREQIGILGRALDEKQRALLAQNAELHSLTIELDSCSAEIISLKSQMQFLSVRFDEVLSSKSWKLTRPVRALGHLVRRTKILTRAILRLISDPASLPKTILRLYRLWHTGGMSAMKHAFIDIPSESSLTAAWKAYQRRFIDEMKPEIVRRINAMPSRPNISIVVPTYNTPEAMLREMLASVVNQLYPHWELCVADDGSTAPHVKRVLQEYASKDRRIRLHLESKNHGVSHASNRALALVTNEFMVLCDHDDLLEPQALFRVAESVLHEQPDMLYSDEVLLTPDLANVLHFAHRPAFSPEYLRAHPYIVHMVGFRTQLIRDLGGFDESLRISQDVDLILRTSEVARVIVHIPEILYQWRMLPESAGTQRQQDVMETSKAVIQRHLDRCNINGIVHEGAGFNLFDTRYPLQAGLNVAIIIPTKNHGDLLRQCIESIRNTTARIEFEIIVIDHESDDALTLAYLASLTPSVRVLSYRGRFNFSAINNWAVSQLDSAFSHYLFCNNDIEAIEPGWLERMLEFGQRHTVGIVGAKLVYPDRLTIQHAGVCVGMFGAAEHYGKFLQPTNIPGELGCPEVLWCNHEVAAVTAACMLVRKDAFDKIGGFDESLAVGFGDVDLCLRVKELGYYVMYCAHAKLIHHESYTRGKSAVDPHPEDSALFQAKWRNALSDGDPYYNPGFSLVSTAWQHANPLPFHIDIKRRAFVVR